MAAYTASVTVRLKPGVLDPEAETTKRALERLDFELEGLRSADRFEIDMEAMSADAAADRADAMATRLLANPTIHDYTVEVDPAETEPTQAEPTSADPASVDPTDADPASEVPEEETPR
jgi:phosphoribosylformylglycinamidine synthase